MAQFLTTSSTLMCPHGGTITATTGNTRAQADGAFILRSSDSFSIASCPFSNGGSASPCSQILWSTQSLKNKVSDYVLTESSEGICMGPSGAQGNVVVSQTQRKGAGD